MKRKILATIIAGIFLISIVSAISPPEGTIDDDSSYSFFEDLIYKLKKAGLFTAAGQSRECSVNADYTFGPVSNPTYVSKESLLNSAGGCNVALFDVFDRDWHFKDEYRSEDVGGFQLSSITSTYNSIVEVYCCPYEACNSDSDCSSSPASNYGDFCNTNYGSCYGDAPSHDTQLYNCVSGNWQSSGVADYGDERFCSDSSDNNYLDKNGAEHCRASSYSSVNDGTWCGETTECTSGQTRCSGTDNQMYQTCGSDGNWDNQGFVDGKCGYTSSVCKTQAQTCTESSQCCSGLTCQNFGCYPAAVCGDDICQSTETMSSCSEDCGTDIPTCGDGDCESGETEGATYECLADCGGGTDPGTTKTITLTEFYSMDDETFAKKQSYACTQTSECPTKSGYTVTCTNDEIFAERNTKYFRDSCDENLGWWDETVNYIIRVVPGFAKADICEAGASFSWSGGTCVAESDTWYGNLWESALKIVGGMGLPAQYVTVITVLLLITIIGMLVRVVT